MKHLASFSDFEIIWELEKSLSMVLRYPLLWKLAIIKIIESNDQKQKSAFLHHIIGFSL